MRRWSLPYDGRSNPVAAASILAAADPCWPIPPLPVTLRSSSHQPTATASCRTAESCPGTLLAVGSVNMHLLGTDEHPTKDDRTIFQVYWHAVRPICTSGVHDMVLLLHNHERGFLGPRSIVHQGIHYFTVMQPCCCMESFSPHGAVGVTRGGHQWHFSPRLWQTACTAHSSLRSPRQQATTHG